MDSERTAGLMVRPSIECWVVSGGADGRRRVLLLRTRPDGRGHQFWQAVTGGIEPGEAPVETCVREIREETGIHLSSDAVSPLDLTFEIPVAEAGWMIHKTVFVAEAPEQPVALSAEHVDARWVAPAEVDAMLHWDTCHAAFARVRERLGLGG